MENLRMFPHLLIITNSHSCCNSKLDTSSKAAFRAWNSSSVKKGSLRASAMRTVAAFALRICTAFLYLAAIDASASRSQPRASGKSFTTTYIGEIQTLKAASYL